MFESSATDPADAADALALLGAGIDAMMAADPHALPVAELGRRLVELQAKTDALAGLSARWARVFESSGGHEDAGAPTMAAWSRRELRLTPAEARRRTRASFALEKLPATAEALFAGQVRMAHVDAIAAGAHRLGPDVIGAFEDVLLDVARTCDPAELRAAVDKVRDVLDPDAADAAHVRAMERRDVTVTPVGDGFALGGFLPPDTGAMLKDVLWAGAKPYDKDDARTAGQRRTDALHDLCKSVLDHGLPSDRGMRPHLYVTVGADRLQAATTGTPSDGTAPAELNEYGPVPDSLLAKLACDCSLTPVVLDKSGRHVLDVGRTERLATPKQRQAILVQQGGTCANPGCDRTRLEIHHLVPWSAGGQTNLADLAGYCSRCHHLIHQGLLITRRQPDGTWAHTTRHGRNLVDKPRLGRRQAATYTRNLLTAGIGYARQEHDRWRKGQPSQPPPTPVRC